MKTAFSIFIYCVFLISFQVLAQQESTEKASQDSWHFIVEPYLMFPNMNGTTGLGNLPDISVDAQPQDIFDNLQIGAMLSTEASKDKWHIGMDFIYMNLEQDINPEGTIVNGKINAKQFAYNFLGLYSVTSWLDVGLGGMLNSIKLESSVNINTNGNTTVNTRENTETWFDPMIIARTQNKPNTKFIYQIRADIGGFGIGSDFAYQFQFYAGYRISKLFQLTGGYRIIGMDYEKNNSSEGILNNNRFLYDMTTFGPVLKLGFNF